VAALDVIAATSKSSIIGYLLALNAESFNHLMSAIGRSMPLMSTENTIVERRKIALSCHSFFSIIYDFERSNLDLVVPKLAVEGSNFFGLIVILLLARKIKALLQKRSSLKVVRMMTQEQKRSFLTDPKTAYFKSKANIFDVFVYKSEASKAAFFWS
jgi:hypothetical protein